MLDANGQEFRLHGPYKESVLLFGNSDLSTESCGIHSESFMRTDEVLAIREHELAWHSGYQVHLTKHNYILFERCIER